MRVARPYRDADAGVILRDILDAATILTECLLRPDDEARGQ